MCIKSRLQPIIRSTITYIQSIITPAVEIGWFIFAEIIFEPILLGLAVFLLFNQIQPIIEYNIKHPDSDLLSGIGADMMANSGLYVIFIVVLLLWVLIRARRIWEERHDRHLLLIYLKLIARKLNVDNQILELLEDDDKKKNGYLYKNSKRKMGGNLDN